MSWLSRSRLECWTALILVMGCATADPVARADQVADDRRADVEVSVDRWLDASALWLEVARTNGSATTDVAARVAAARFDLLGVRLTRTDVTDPVKAAAFARVVTELENVRARTEPSPNDAKLEGLEQDLANAVSSLRTAIDSYDSAAKAYDLAIENLPAGSLNRLDGTPMRPRVALRE